jgi:FAD synthetase
VLTPHNFYKLTFCLSHSRINAITTKNILEIATTFSFILMATTNSIVEELMNSNDNYNNNNNNNDDLNFLLKKIDIELFHKKLRHSVDVLTDAIQLTREAKGDKELCISFNGGKDCCVVLYLFYKIALKSGFISEDGKISEHKFNILIMKLNEPFKEMDEFVNRIFQEYYTSKDINLIVLDKPKMKLKKCLEEFKKAFPNIMHVLMGTRRTDNQYVAKLNDFSETDADWPKFIRVNPILDWNYFEIWYFLKRFNVPYCSLYDLGYTSLGDINNSIRNEALKDPQTGLYKPAYMLENAYNERNSRI